MELESELEDEVEDLVHSDEDTKYLVFDQQLQQLFKRCQECGEVILEDCTTKHSVGSMLVVKTICAAGHEVRWQSQQTYGRAPAGNVLLAAAILFAGGLFLTFNIFAEALKLVFISSVTYYKYQRTVLCPLIHHGASTKNQCMQSCQEAALNFWATLGATAQVTEQTIAHTQL